jgi:hypothetical protein
MKKGKHVSVTEFRRLLHDIKDRRPDVGVRVRLIGKMWIEFFYSVEAISNDEVLLHNIYKNMFLHIRSISDVIQFELECSFFGFQAYYHYEVIPLPAEISYTT